MKDIYDKTSVQKPNKKPLARKLLERVHLATHYEMESDEAVALVTAEMAAKREYFRAATDEGEKARAAAAYEEYFCARASAWAGKGHESY